MFCVHDLLVTVEESHSRSETWAEGTLESECQVGSLILSDLVKEQQQDKYLTGFVPVI